MTGYLLLITAIGMTSPGEPTILRKEFRTLESCETYARAEAGGHDINWTCNDYRHFAVEGFRPPPPQRSYSMAIEYLQCVRTSLSPVLEECVGL